MDYGVSNDSQSAGVTIQPCRRQFIADELLLLAVFLVLIILPGIPDLLPSGVGRTMLAASLLSAALLTARYMKIRFMRYEISAEQLMFRRGVLSMHCEYIELYRVTDYEERRSFLQMLLGLKTVVVISGDPSMPHLDIIGIPADRDIVPLLRQRVEFNKKKRGVHEITNR